ncbi:MAG: NAD-dependent epimerase/dehydratase family protein [Methanolobus sp.]|uniref:NAD-dependent epimerase/dehydratase family protein n=1 Tax=Methanolobus sp. TaxID=1874737 RepID=UPI0027318369|nr:NAD-dependent epimerase/dehydratase family protein [Methanolobus sp.]MDP2216038.1 NAD-dependent epimerase/dehydratase family protein [Methanolobus sp.]
MEKILITGGLGQIGSYLVDRLHACSQVTVLDNMSSGSRYVVPEGVRLVKEDILSPRALDLAADHDVVIHTAAQISVVRSMQEPVFDAQNNVFGTLNLLEGARLGGVRKFIYISSAAVYGNPQYLPIDEEHPQDPMSPYGASKLCGEKYCIMYNRAYGLPAVCIRPFNIYSPRQDPSNPYSGVISKFISRVSQNLPPIIFGDGSQTRDFVSAHDVVDMISMLMDDEQPEGVVFNVGTGISTRIDELARMVLDAFGSDAGIEFRDPVQGDIKDSYSDISRAQKAGYSPKVDLRSGLLEVIKAQKPGQA